MGDMWDRAAIDFFRQLCLKCLWNRYLTMFCIFVKTHFTGPPASFTDWQVVLCVTYSVKFIFITHISVTQTFLIFSIKIRKKIFFTVYLVFIGRALVLAYNFFVYGFTVSLVHLISLNHLLKWLALSRAFTHLVRHGFHSLGSSWPGHLVQAVDNK